MWCVISPSSRCPSCTVTAGWASGMGGLISPLSIRSLLAVLEMGGNTIPLQFDLKPHRSISWTPLFRQGLLSFSLHSLSLSPTLSVFHSVCFIWLNVSIFHFHSLLLFVNCFCDVILLRGATLRFVIKSKFAAITFLPRIPSSLAFLAWILQSYYRSSDFTRYSVYWQSGFSIEWSIKDSTTLLDFVPEY